MDVIQNIILTIKAKNSSHVGYGLQSEFESLVCGVLQNMAKSPMPLLKIEKKNNIDSVKYRADGNEYFVGGDDNRAIESYTKSLAYADTDLNKAYAYANRSAALYRKKLFKECIADITRAIELNYPLDKRNKLEERAAKAIEEINDNDENENKNKNKNLNSKVMSVPYGASNEAPANSAGVKISYSHDYGRHLVATCNFKPGDITTIEQPYCWVIYQDKFYTHCHYCLERCFNLIPCSECPIAQYCSPECKNLSWDIGHNIECSILSVLINLLNMDEDKVRMVMKITRLLLTVTSNGTKINELREDLKIAEKNSDVRTAGFTDKFMLDSKSPRSALSLATNVTTRPLIGISAFACISALSIMLISTQTTFFGKKLNIEELKYLNKYPDIKFCGSLLLRACVITSSNCFSIQPEPGIKSGSGLYVAHSLYNHSCAPNTFRHFQGLTMITRAVEPIYPGQQIFTGYGADYSYMPKTQRKKKLMDEYFFDCNCPGCINDWPTYNDILKNHIGSISNNKNIVQQLKPFRKRLIDNKFDIEAVKEVINILHNQVKVKPCEEILHAVHYLRTYYLDIFKEHHICFIQFLFNCHPSGIYIDNQQSYLYVSIFK